MYIYQTKCNGISFRVPIGVNFFFLSLCDKFLIKFLNPFVNHIDEMRHRGSRFFEWFAISVGNVTTLFLILFSHTN